MDVKRIDSKKQELLCRICNRILKDPVHLPCYCTICDVHLKDDTLNGILFKCATCGDEFVLKNIQYKVSRFAKLMLDKEEYLSDDEKAIKSDVGQILDQFQQLFDQFKQEQTSFAQNASKHFAEIKQQIEIQRENLKEKIDGLGHDSPNRTARTNVQAKAELASEPQY